MQDLKLGHYMKVPPRATFYGERTSSFVLYRSLTFKLRCAVQLTSLSISCALQVGVKQWLLHNVPDLCDRHQESLLTCPQTTVFYSASIIW